MQSLNNNATNFTACVLNNYPLANGINLRSKLIPEGGEGSILESDRGLDQDIERIFFQFSV